MRRDHFSAVVVLFILSMGLLLSCSSGDDDDDDDKAGSDDDNGEYTCNGIASAMVDDCGWMTLDLTNTDVDETGFSEWCTQTEELWAGDTVTSPFWICMGNAAVKKSCDLDYANHTCCAPDDPGSGCGQTVHAVYSCKGYWALDEAQNYQIPQMDLQNLCADYTDWPWDCYATCVANNPCSEEPSEAETQALMSCLATCEETE